MSTGYGTVSFGLTEASQSVLTSRANGIQFLLVCLTSIQYTSMVVHTGILGYFQKTHQKELKFPERKELLLINMEDTHGIEYSLVPNIKGKSELWQHFSLCIYMKDRKPKLMLMLLYINSENHCQTCSRHLKHVNAHKAPPSLTVAWVTCGEPSEGRQTCPQQSVTAISNHNEDKIPSCYRYIFCTHTQLYR